MMHQQAHSADESNVDQVFETIATPLFLATDHELQAHEAFLSLIEKKSGQKPAFEAVEQNKH